MYLRRCRQQIAVSLLALTVLLPTTAHARKPDTFMLMPTVAVPKGQEGPAIEPLLFNQKVLPPQPLPVALTGVAVTPTSLAGGQNAVGKVTLNTIATADVPVTLKSANPHLTVPDTVTVPAGERSQTFQIQTTRIQALTNIAVNATLLAKTLTAHVTLKPVVLTSATFRPKQMKGGASTALTVKLSGAAPAGGLTIGLFSSDPDRLPAPPQVTIPEGNTSVVVSISTDQVKVNEKITVKASENGVTLVANFLLIAGVDKQK